jgi:hypothetical protein
VTPRDDLRERIAALIAREIDFFADEYGQRPGPDDADDIAATITDEIPGLVDATNAREGRVGQFGHVDYDGETLSPQRVLVIPAADAS